MLESFTPTMKYKIETWTIKKLLSEHKKGNLNLNPPYQRNDIWTEKAQKDLIDTIKNGLPIPNFFMHIRGSGKFDVADGQQRTRAILAYSKGEITDGNKVNYNSSDKPFLAYKLAVLVIDESVSQEEIRSFYVKVNNTGLRLNKPELTKAEYHSSKVMALVEDLVELQSFKSLGLFKSRQEDRMIDREFIEELTAQLKYGVGDKKLGIERLYKEGEGLTQDEIIILKDNFNKVIDIINELNNRYPLAGSRYSQKNDFYTLFGFVKDNIAIKQSTFNLFYDVLLKIGVDINPSNEACEPLQLYAFNCVTQSNSRQARLARQTFFRKLLQNNESTANEVQRKLIEYYNLSLNDMIEVEAFFTLDPEKIKPQFSEI